MGAKDRTAVGAKNALDDAMSVMAMPRTETMTVGVIILLGLAGVRRETIDRKGQKRVLGKRAVYVQLR